MAMACRIAPRHCLTKGSRSLNKAIRARARAAWNFVTVVVGKPSRAASSVHSPGTWNWASTGVALMSKAAATITDRIMIPMLGWTTSRRVLCPIQVVKPLLLPVGCLSLLSFETLFIVFGAITQHPWPSPGLKNSRQPVKGALRHYSGWVALGGADPQGHTVALYLVAWCPPYADCLLWGKRPENIGSA
jgi:hypothetical protein